MKDRVPTKVVNGAIRMEVLNEAGEHVEYLYLKRADEPLEEGTPLNKNNLLKDETAKQLGLTGNNPTINDAFNRIGIAYLRSPTLLKSDTVPVDAETFSKNYNDIDLLDCMRVIAEIEYEAYDDIVDGDNIDTPIGITMSFGNKNVGDVSLAGLPKGGTAYIVFDNVYGRNSSCKMCTRGYNYYYSPGAQYMSVNCFAPLYWDTGFVVPHNISLSMTRVGKAKIKTVTIYMEVGV